MTATGLVQSPELQAVSLIKEVAWGLASTAAVVAAVRLGLPDAVDDERPVPPAELASRLKLDPDALARLMHALACRGVFQRDERGRYHHTDLSRLLRDDHPYSVSYLVQWIGARCFWPLWPTLAEAVRTGQAMFPEMYGKEVFPYVHEDAPDIGAVLNRAMTQASRHTSAAIAERLDVSGVQTVADIGGGHGHLLRTVLEQYPGLRGVLFDLASVVTGADPELRHGTLADRCEVVGGDCRQAVPVRADLYLLKNILEWKDEYTVATLRNVAASAAPGARVMIIETLLDQTPEPQVTTALDLLLLLNVAGRKHTSDHVAELFRRSGLEPVGVRPTGTFLSFAEATVPVTASP